MGDDYSTGHEASTAIEATGDVADCSVGCTCKASKATEVAEVSKAVCNTYFRQEEVTQK